MMTKIAFKLVLLMMLVVPACALADSTWIGDVIIRSAHRGVYAQSAFTGQAISDNLADYNNYQISFEFYKQGVTDNDSISVWQNIDAQVELVQDSTQKVLRKSYISFTGRDGNNAIYEMFLLTPDTVTTLDPELQNRGTMRAHLNIIMDGAKMFSIPCNFTYTP